MYIVNCDVYWNSLNVEDFCFNYQHFLQVATFPI